MTRGRYTITTLAALAVPGALLVVPATANHDQASAGDYFTCRASVVRITGQGPLAGLGTLEPIVANGGAAQCNDRTAGVANQMALPGGLGTLSVLYARTNDDPHSKATAAAGVLDVTLNLPAPVGTVRVQVLTSQAQAGPCVDESPPTLSGESHVLAVDIGGQRIEPVAGHRDVPLPLPAPAGPAVLHLNEQTSSPNQLTQQALFLDTGIVDVVIAEAIVDYHGNPCDSSNPQRLPGWMGGGGYVAEPGTRQDHNGQGSVEPGTRAQHAFNLDCFTSEGVDPKPGKDNLVAQWFDAAGREHATFRLTRLTDTRCFDDPALNPTPPRSGFDTIEGSGSGTCRAGGQEVPATVSFRLSDAGEPGRADNTRIRVSSPAEGPLALLCNYTADGLLDGGNHQAHQTPGQRSAAAGGANRSGA